MWGYLDKMDKNLLYSYAQVLAGERKELHIIRSESDIEQAERKRKMTYYLTWFVYRYILECNTLEKALEYASEETLKKYKLYSYIIHGNIYIGVDKEVCIRKPEDIGIVLEILYKRYDLFKQLKCYIRHTKGIRKKRCEAVLERYKQFAEDYVRCRE